MSKSIRITLTEEEYMAIFAAVALHEVQFDDEDEAVPHGYAEEMQALDRVCDKINRARS